MYNFREYSTIAHSQKEYSSPCYYCESIEHKSENCKNKSKFDFKNTPCYYCNSIKHESKNCLDKNNIKLTLRLGHFKTDKSIYVASYSDFDKLRNKFIDNLISSGIIGILDNTSTRTYIEYESANFDINTINNKEFMISERNFLINRDSIILKLKFFDYYYPIYIPIIIKQNLINKNCENNQNIKMQIKKIVFNLIKYDDIKKYQNCCIIN
jgi:hypothetical protein